MAESVLLDTNVLLRYLTNDDPRKAARCADLLQRAADGKIELVLSDVCLAELVWTLASHYRIAKAEIANRIEAIISAPGLTCSDLHLWLDVMRRFETTSVSFIDAYHAAMAAQNGQRVCSYDRDFDRFPDIQRFEP